MPNLVAVTTTDQTSPLDAGHTTTEYGLAKAVIIITSVVGLLGTVTEILDKITTIVPASTKGLGMWLAIGGVVVAGLTGFAYNLQRTLIKIAAIKAGKTPPADPAASNPDAAAARLGQ